MDNYYGMELTVESTSKYDLPTWMKDEKMYNCGGFTTSYYKDLLSATFKKFRLFR